MIGPVLSVVVAIAAAGIMTMGCGAQAAPPAPTAVPPAATKPAQAATPSPTKPAPTAQAADSTAKKVSFPEKGKPITLIIPWDAGGGTDVGARVTAMGMEKQLGVPVQPVNKPGASGQVGLTELVKSKPDGYTIAITSQPTTISVYLDATRKAVYGRKDFQPIANVWWTPATIGVKAAGPYKSLKDLVDAAKAKPEGLKVATAGLMTNTHLDLLAFQKATGTSFAAVHFNGGAPAITAMLGDHVDATSLTAANFFSQVKSGEVRLLGVMDSQGSKFYPDVKTMEAQGFKLYSGSSVGIVAPVGTPKEIVDVLSNSIKAATETDETKKKMDEGTLEIRYMDGAQYAAYWEQLEGQVKPLMESAK